MIRFMNLNQKNSVFFWLYKYKSPVWRHLHWNMKFAINVIPCMSVYAVWNNEESYKEFMGWWWLIKIFQSQSIWSILVKCSFSHFSNIRIKINVHGRLFLPFMTEDSFSCEYAAEGLAFGNSVYWVRFDEEFSQKVSSFQYCRHFVCFPYNLISSLFSGSEIQIF